MGILKDLKGLIGKSERTSDTAKQLEAIAAALKAIAARREELRAEIKAADEARAALLLDDTAADRRRQLRADAEDAAEVLEALAIEEKSLRTRHAGLLSVATREQLIQDNMKYREAGAELVELMRACAKAGAKLRAMRNEVRGSEFGSSTAGYFPAVPSMGSAVTASIEIADRFEIELSQSSRALANAPMPAAPRPPVDIKALNAAHGNLPVQDWLELQPKAPPPAQPPNPTPVKFVYEGTKHRPTRPLLRIEGPIPEDHVPVKFIVGGAELSDKLTAVAGDEIALPKSQAEMLVKHSRAVYLYSDDKKEAAE